MLRLYAGHQDEDSSDLPGVFNCDIINLGDCDMTAFEIIVSCVGMILCALICSLCVVVIAGLCWWAFKRDMQNDEEQEDYD